MPSPLDTPAPNPFVPVDAASERIAALAAELTGDAAQVAVAEDRFWTAVAEEGTPLIEEDTEYPGYVLMTFLYREDTPVRGVTLQDLASWMPEQRRTLSRVGDSRTWALTLRANRRLRTRYNLSVTGIDGETSVVEDATAAVATTPNWAPGIMPVAEAVMPDAERFAWLADDSAPLLGTVEEHDFASEILGNTRKVWTYLPPVEAADPAGLPFVVVFDGVAWHSNAGVLDRLIAAGKIPPTAAIIVSQEIDGENNRNEELPGIPAFSSMLATELVPWARERYGLSTDPADAALNGCSFGGLCSAYTALKHPEVFGNAIMQSGSCWYYRGLPGDDTRFQEFPVRAVGDSHPTPLLIEEFLAAPTAPVRIYQEAGSVENGPQVAQVWQTFANRWFRDVLEAKGYEHAYSEYVGGHDDAWWRGTFAEGAIWAFAPALRARGGQAAAQAAAQ